MKRWDVTVLDIFRFLGYAEWRFGGSFILASLYSMRWILGKTTSTGTEVKSSIRAQISEPITFHPNVR